MLNRIHCDTRAQADAAADLSRTLYREGWSVTAIPFVNDAGEVLWVANAERGDEYRGAEGRSESGAVFGLYGLLCAGGRVC